jgi:hypothetical protein
MTQICERYRIHLNKENLIFKHRKNVFCIEIICQSMFFYLNLLNLFFIELTLISDIKLNSHVDIPNFFTV